MNLVLAANAPRVWWAEGTPYFLGRLTLRGLACLQAHLDVEAAGAAFGTPEADAALWRWEGRTVLLWAGLYLHNPGFTLAQAAALAHGMDAPEFQRYLAAFCRPEEAIPQPRETPEGQDPAPRPPFDWYRYLEIVEQKRPGWTRGTILDLTPHQVKLILDEGKDRLSPEQVQALAAAAQEGKDEDASDAGGESQAEVIPQIRGIHPNVIRAAMQRLADARARGLVPDNPEPNHADADASTTPAPPGQITIPPGGALPPGWEPPPNPAP